MEETKQKIRIYALQNAVRHGKPPRADAVLKQILGEHQELRKEAKQVYVQVKTEIERIEAMSKEVRAEELNNIAPELVEGQKEHDKEVREFGLPDLPRAEGEKVVMRFAPNPNGAATLGSTRGIIVNSEYARRYNGKFILRFDDTDPVVKRPLLEAYDWYLEDCDWLDARPDEVVVASERIDLYYKYAEELIEKGVAYVCFCPAEVFKNIKDRKDSCPDRAASIETNAENWRKMLDGVYEEKEAVLRIKTDMAAKDPALRDWVAFRILKKDHPRVGNRYEVWPNLDFESAIEDHLLGITHIVRGKDLMKSETRQQFLYDHLGWQYPVTKHWGKIKMQEFGKFSTSELRKRIEQGEYEGWDDPRLPTLKALRRRGFQPEAIRKFFISLGVSQTDIAVSMKNMYAENRKAVDADASPYFFVPEPAVEMQLLGEGPFVAEGTIYSLRKGALPPGTRLTEAFAAKYGTQKHMKMKTESPVYISDEDSVDLQEGQKIRLKYLGPVEIVSTKPLVARDIRKDIKKDAQTVAGMHVILWAPSSWIKITVKRPDGRTDEGIGASQIASKLGNVVQFERYGFVRIDSVTDNEVVAYFTH